MMPFQDIPLSQWIFQFEEEKENNINNKSAGLSLFNVTKYGQVPKTKDGQYTAEDISILNRHIQQAFQLATKMRISHSNLPVPHLATSADLQRVITQFSLGDIGEKESYPVDELLVPRGLGPISTTARTKFSNVSRSGIDKKLEKCRILDEKQQDRQIFLTYSNLLTLYPGRWLDSVAIDSMLHIMKRYWKFGDLLYVNSSQRDPTLGEIQQTPDCFKYILVPLFLKSHWTIVFIDHVKQSVRYLNSQVIDEKTPAKQSQPFRQAFPGYQVNTFTKPQQNDDSSCGMFLLLFAFLFLFYDDSSIDNVTQSLVDEFRSTVLLEILLHFVVLRRD